MVLQEGKNKLLFPGLRHLKSVREKIASGEPVSIGVFCSGNMDRSPLVEQVMKKEFENKGFKNVKVFSFGISIGKDFYGKPPSKKTQEYVTKLGYPEIVHNKSKYIGQVKKEIEKSDLLLAVSPSHVAYAAENVADKEGIAPHRLLSKTWTLKGFANKKEWKMAIDGVARAFRRQYRGLATNDPHLDPENHERQLEDAVKDAKKAVARLLKK